ncbi:fimbrial protein [Pseudomonas fluorescens]|uniref:fimbrial protein n=1 Tax=Pseudomonas fluorescens TaxID=294 RepID=UPI001CD3169F|nr:fimbrial protein [Pseudomonas fluorescens]
MDVNVALIKAGPVAAGQIDGTMLPVMEQTWRSSNDLLVQRVAMTGMLSVHSRTCNTPDVAVYLGRHPVAAFAAAPQTEWVDFSIRLTDCPAFLGFYSGVGPRWGSDGSVTGLNSRIGSVLRYQLDPVVAPIDAMAGIIDLNGTSVADASSAQGVGIQIADRQGNSIQLSRIVDSHITPTAIEGEQYAIDLRAHYVKTADLVTPGRADGSVVFTIIYH